jgi:hypothetical protein
MDLFFLYLIIFFSLCFVSLLIFFLNIMSFFRLLKILLYALVYNLAFIYIRIILENNLIKTINPFGD